MGADVIPFAPRPARPPRASASGAHAHARAEWWRARHEQLSRERAAEEESFWKADLETYPPKFREVLEIDVSLTCSWPMAFERRGPGFFHRERQDTDHDFAKLVAASLGRYRSAVRWIVETRREGRNPCTRTRDEAVQELLGILWRRGRRRILRADLELYAMQKVAEEREALERGIARSLESLERDRARLAGGVFVSGKRRGQALTGGYLECLKAGISEKEELLTERRRRLSALDAEPDPMRAAGIWPRRRSTA